MQFKSLCDRDKIGLKINVVSKDEHAPVIEWCHRVLEELCRCHHAMLPFKHVPRQIVVQLLKKVVFY